LCDVPSIGIGNKPIDGGNYLFKDDEKKAAKAAADKFNEAFSKGDTISQEDFAAALVDLKKSRDLIEGVLEEKYGEETTVGGVTPQPRDGGYSDFRNATYSGRAARAVRAGGKHSEEFKTGKIIAQDASSYLAAKNLSRTLEDSGTVIVPLIPWSAAGAYMTATLGVPTVEYLPWAILNYMGVVFAIILALTGIGIAKINRDTK